MVVASTRAAHRDGRAHEACVIFHERRRGERLARRVTARQDSLKRRACSGGMIAAVQYVVGAGWHRRPAAARKDVLVQYRGRA